MLPRWVFVRKGSGLHPLTPGSRRSYDMRSRMEIHFNTIAVELLQWEWPRQDKASNGAESAASHTSFSRPAKPGLGKNV